MIRALMEGVAFDLRHSLECFKRLGSSIDELRIGEGGAKSELWRTIQADVFGQDVRIMETREVSAYRRGDHCGGWCRLVFGL